MEIRNRNPKGRIYIERTSINELISRVSDAVLQCGEFIKTDENKTGISEYPVMGLNLESRLLFDTAAALRKGIFRVLLMGDDPDRKRSLHNALVDHPIFNGISFVDAEGFAASYLTFYDAVIITLNAEKFLSVEERKFLAKLVQKKGIKNVFFAIYYISGTAEDITELKNITEYYLKSIFTETGEISDDTFCDCRVFYISEENTSRLVGTDNQKLSDEPGLDALIHSLYDYLMTEDKIAAGFWPFLSAIPCVWAKAERIIKVSASFLEIQDEMSVEAALLSECELTKAIEELDGINKAFKAAANLVTAKIYGSLLNYLYSMESSWEADLERIDRKTGLIDTLRTSTFYREDELNEVIDRTIKEAKEYIAIKFEDWFMMLDLLLHPELLDLHNIISNSAEAVLYRLQKALSLFTGQIGDNEHFTAYGLKGDQKLFNLMGIQPGLLSEYVTSFGAAWEYALKKLVHNVIISLVRDIFSVEDDWLISSISDAVCKKSEADHIEKLLPDIKSRFFKKRKIIIEEQQVKLESVIHTEFDNQRRRIIEVLSNLVDDERRRLEELLTRKKKQHDRLTDYHPYDIMRQELLRRINLVFEAVYGKNMTEEELLQQAGTQ